MRRGVLLCWVALSSCAPRSPTLGSQARPVHSAPIETTLLLIGDAGAPASPEPILDALQREIRRVPAITTVVFLGDNIYPSGMPNIGARSREDAESRIDAQIAASSDAASVYFVAGNHDWTGRGDDAWEAVRRQGRYLIERGAARMLPEGGCPGPSVVDLEPQVRLVLLDTQWWLQEERGGGSFPTCSPGTNEGVVSELERVIGSSAGRHVVVAGHHPLLSSGPHGGRFGWLDHLFPLRAVARWAWIPVPVIGSIYPIARSLGIWNQDAASSEYASLRDALERVFSRQPPLAYVAGHEHLLEVHRGPGAEYTLVSGGGSSGRWDAPHPREGTIFTIAAGGFMRIDVYEDARVLLTVITADPGGESSISWEEWLR